MDSYKSHNYEQALMETYLKLDELLKNDKVNQFLYDINFNNENKYENYQSSKSINRSSSTANQKDNSNKNFVTIRYKSNYINIDLTDNRSNCNSDNNNEPDDNFCCDIRVAREMGTTANILLINNGCLYLANCGDSLSVMYKNGEAIKLNQEHKTTLKSEYERIIKCGGQIINNRIEGKLNLTRAIGDLEFKKSPNIKCYDQSVIASPEITKIKNTEGIEFIIMGCDGLWDCVEPQKLCENISARLKSKNEKISDIIGDIFDTIISKSNNSKILLNNLYYSSYWNR